MYDLTIDKIHHDMIILNKDIKLIETIDQLVNDVYIINKTTLYMIVDDNACELLVTELETDLKNEFFDYYINL